jgi:hypothetical protein
MLREKINRSEMSAGQFSVDFFAILQNSLALMFISSHADKPTVLQS